MPRRQIREADVRRLLSEHLARTGSLGIFLPTLSVGLNTNLRREKAAFLSSGRLVCRPDELLSPQAQMELGIADVSREEVERFVDMRIDTEAEADGKTDKLTRFIVTPSVPHRKTDEFGLRLQGIRNGCLVTMWKMDGGDVVEEFDSDLDGEFDKASTDSTSSKDCDDVSQTEFEVPYGMDIAKLPIEDVLVKPLVKSGKRRAHLVEFINAIHKFFIDLDFTWLEFCPLAVVSTETATKMYNYKRISTSGSFSSDNLFKAGKSPTDSPLFRGTPTQRMLSVTPSPFHSPRLPCYTVPQTSSSFNNEDKLLLDGCFGDFGSLHDDMFTFSFGDKAQQSPPPQRISHVIPLHSSGIIDYCAYERNKKKLGEIEFPEPWGRPCYEGEMLVDSLAAPISDRSSTKTSIRLSVLNPDGNMWFIAVGAGSAMIVADTIIAHGYGAELGNYCEYSGPVTEDQMYQLSRTILGLATANRENKPPGKGRVLFIGGCICNYNDVSLSMKGFQHAIREFRDEIDQSNMLIIVRRVGPNYHRALSVMKDCSDEMQLDIRCFGPEVSITSAVALGLTHLKTGNVRIKMAKKKDPDQDIVDDNETGSTPPPLSLPVTRDFQASVQKLTGNPIRAPSPPSSASSDGEDNGAPPSRIVNSGYPPMSPTLAAIFGSGTPKKIVNPFLL